MGTLTEKEQAEITAANESGRRPVMFVHGLWLLPSSWDKWRELFEEAGYSTIAPGWPDDPETVAEAKADPTVFAKKGLKMIRDHYVEAIEALDHEPAIVGHSFGGDLAQMLAGLGHSAATVAIDPAQFRGVLPLPLTTLKSGAPVLSNPTNAHKAVTLTFEQFNYGWTHLLPEDEAKALYEEYHVAGSGTPLFQAAAANFNPWTEDKVDSLNAERGPLLLVSGDEDHTVPLAVVKAEFDKQKRNSGVTELTVIEGRTHSLTIDSGWHEVADIALKFISDHAPVED